MSLFKLSVLVQAIDQLSGPIRQMQQAVQGLDRVAGAARGLVKWGQGAAAAGALLGASAAGITGALAAPVKASANFSEAMASVQAVTQASGEDLAKLRGQARELGATTQFSASQAAGAMKEFGLAGFKTNEILSAMPPALDLAKAANVGLSDTVEITAAIMKSFGLQAGQFGNIGDLLTAGFTSSATGLRDLGSAVSFAGLTAHRNNISLAETVGLVAKLSDAGIKGSRAGTSLNAIISRLAAPTGEAQAALASLGVTAFDAATRQFRPILDILKDLDAGLARNGDEAFKAAKLQEVFGLEVASAADALIKQAGNGALGEYFDSLKDVNDLAARTARIMGDNLTGSFLELKSATESLFITLGDQLEPMLIALNETARDLIGWLDSWAQAHPVLSEGLLVTIASLGGLLAIVAPVLLAVGLLSTTFGYVGIGAAGVGRALVFMGGQMAVVRGGLSIFGQALVSGPVHAFGALRGAILSAMEAVAFRGGLGAFLQFQALRASLGLQAAATGARAWALSLRQAGMGAIIGLPARITALTLALHVNTLAFLANIRAAFSSFTAFRSMAGGLLTRLAGGLRLVGGGIRAIGLALAANPVGLAVAVIAGAALLIFRFWGPIKSFFQGVFSGLREGLAPLAPAFAVLGQVFSAILAPIRAIGGFIADLLTPAHEASEGATQLGHSFGRVFGTILSWTVLLPVRLIGFVANMVGALFSGIGQIWSRITGFFGSLIETIKAIFADGFLVGIGRILLSFNPLALLARSFNALFQFVFGINLFEAGSKIISSLWEGMKAFASKPIETIEEIVQNVRNFLPFSPAKVGPLRDLNRIRLIETVAETITPAPLVNAVRGAVAATGVTLAASGAALAVPIVPQASIVQAPQIASLPAEGRSSHSGAQPVTVQIAYKPQVTIHAGAIDGESGDEGLKDQIMRALRDHDQELLALIRDAMDTDARSDFA